ncbi:hypothetical protein LK994_07975 [Ferruginibacter lapsinanis]|uniref:hypothetical protein n=1 Tax=Ferruginibacter lapsinanis TaxID=563172 RepID=UPI001E528505|nr:hypothetical protein [Ferruginibacter lapsinanis]UEG48572.1 hypothetical protein LK994_07975 [Ferruginibacter lapsinanis]
MNPSNSSNDVLNFAEENNSKLPQSLNVLTILTFIGCGIGALGAVATPFIMKFSKEMMDKATSMSTEMSDKQLADIARGKHMIELTQQNIIPLTIIGVISIIACLVGALWMRKLKKDGYWLYVSGEVLPLIGNAVFLGAAAYADWKSYLGLLVPVVFIILYTLQRKYLVK